MSNLEHNAAVREPADAVADTAESLGELILSLLPTLRLHSVSLCDASGNVQWLNAGSLGPDEQSAVASAIATLTEAPTRAHCEVPLVERAALFLAVRTPRRDLAGLVMLLMDAKTLSSGNLAARILNTRMRAALQKTAIFLSPPPPGGGTPAPLAAVSDVALQAPHPSGEPSDVVSDVLVNDILDWESAQSSSPPPPQAAAPGPTAQAPVAPGNAAVAAADMPLLRLRELARLRPGGRARFYQIVPLVTAQRGDAVTTLAQLDQWLRQNPKVHGRDTLHFMIGVTPQHLADPALPQALATLLTDSPLAAGCIGFELREAACITHRAQAEKFLALCVELQCFAVIDDFTFNTAMLELLRSPAVRMLKVDARLAAAAMREKLSQARVIAISQAAKVLGMHCVSKYVDAPAGRSWLASAGFDFNQASQDEPLERLVGR